MKTKSIIVTAIIAAIALPSCRNDEPEEAKEPTRDTSFTEIFGTPDHSHIWNLATRVTVNVTADHQMERVEVFTDYHGTTYRLIDLNVSSRQEVVNFDAVSDMTDFTLVVDGLVLQAKDGQEVFALGRGHRPDWADQAQDLGWIMAVDTDLDFDFNDIVARFVPQPDGGVTITALACGTTGPHWLHYTNGTADYVLCPDYPTGSLEASWIDEWYAPDMTWHTWFGSEEVTPPSMVWTVNTMGSGGNDVPGKSLTIPADMMGGSRFFPTYLSLAEGSDDDVRPTLGFYVSQGMWDIKRPLDDEEVKQAVYAALPAGNAPVMLVIPDICMHDHEGNYGPWYWPTEGSRIDMVYPRFKSWLKDPSLLWSLEQPEGWSNYPGVKDENGNFKYYGYYTR